VPPTPAGYFFFYLILCSDYLSDDDDSDYLSDDDDSAIITLIFTLIMP
jgi:hypothetical protein